MPILRFYFSLIKKNIFFFKRDKKHQQINSGFRNYFFSDFLSLPNLFYISFVDKFSRFIFFVVAIVSGLFVCLFF